MAIQLPAVFHNSKEQRHQGQADGGVVRAHTGLPQTPQNHEHFSGRQPAKPAVQQQGY